MMDDSFTDIFKKLRNHSILYVRDSCHIFTTYQKDWFFEKSNYLSLCHYFWTYATVFDFMILDLFCRTIRTKEIFFFLTLFVKVCSLYLYFPNVPRMWFLMCPSNLSLLIKAKFCGLISNHTHHRMTSFNFTFQFDVSIRPWNNNIHAVSEKKESLLISSARE